MLRAFCAWETNAPLCCGAHWTNAYADIGFDVLGDEAFKQMVLARLIEPCSKEATINVLERLGIEHVSRRTLFHSLKRCAQRA